MKNRVPRRPKMKRLCVRGVAKILAQGGSRDERRMAAESCDSALKDAVMDCARANRRGTGRGKKLVLRLSERSARHPDLQPVVNALETLERDAHGRAHHQGLPEALSDTALATYRRLVLQHHRNARSLCRRILVGEGRG